PATLRLAVSFPGESRKYDRPVPPLPGTVEPFSWLGGLGRARRKIFPAPGLHRSASSFPDRLVRRILPRRSGSCRTHQKGPQLLARRPALRDHPRARTGRQSIAGSRECGTAWCDRTLEFALLSSHSAVAV